MYEGHLYAREKLSELAREDRGAANRLLAEREHPVCDVFWGNEEFRARQLAAAGIFVPTNGWAAFGHRSRCLVVRTNASGKPDQAFVPPRTLVELTNAAYRGRVSMAFPLFGTTATHLLALRQLALAGLPVPPSSMERLMS